MHKQISRRDFLKLTGASSLLPFLSKPAATQSTATKNREWIVTGDTFVHLNSFNDAMQNFMQARNISGAALAVTRNSRLVLARGYTYSDDDEDLIVQPDSLFRIASISKPITSVAILQLVQNQQLDLSAKLTDLLTLTPPPSYTADSRLNDITVLHLLQHLGGWDRNLVYDPMFRDAIIATVLNKSLPISKTDVATYMAGQHLQHTPGTTFAYSNFGYSLLGQIIEAVTGQSYESYVINNIFHPLKITGAVLGRTLPEHRRADEVKYHTQYTGRTVFDDSGETVSLAYGGWNLDNMDAHGGWLASAVTLARFAAALDDPATSPLLNEDSIDFMFGLPENIPPASYSPGEWYYGCGWSVRDWQNGYRNTWHDGRLHGTSTLLVRRGEGLNWCVLFNQFDDPSGLSYSEIDGLLYEAANAVPLWHPVDLFDNYVLDEQIYLPMAIK